MIVGPEVFSEDGRMIEVDDLIAAVGEPEPNRVFLAPVGGVPDATEMPPLGVESHVRTGQAQLLII